MKIAFILLMFMFMFGCVADDPEATTAAPSAASEPSLPNTTGCYRDGCLVCCPYWTEWGTAWNCTTDAQCECTVEGGWWVRCGASMCCILDY